jgi:hypothetical protein
MLVAQKDLDFVHPKWKSSLGGTKDTSFGILYLRSELRKPESEFSHRFLFTTESLGIHAYHIDIQRKNLYLYRFSWNSGILPIKDSMKKLAVEGLDKLFGGVAPESNERKFINQLRSECLENQGIIQRVFIYFVFNGDPDLAERSEAIGSLREDLENKKHVLDTFFQKNISLTIDFLSNQTRKRAGLSHTTTTHNYKVRLPQPPIQRKTAGGEEMNLCILRLVDLYKMYQEMGQRLFDRNIRSALSLENTPNKSIRSALKSIVIGKKSPPDEFVFHHNGVTLFAEQVTWSENSAILTEPRVLNGAQTISSFAGFLEENHGNPQLEANKKIMDSIEVLAKIVTSENQETLKDFVVKVTINTNRQNPVEPWNLRASDLIQLEFADKFREELNIFYERQENAFGALSFEDLEDLGIEEQYKFISIKKLAQTFLATQGEIDKLGRLKDCFESETTYQNMFKRKYLEVSASKILLVYKIQNRLGKAMDSILESAPNKFYFIKRAKSWVWAILIQAVLNDKRLSTNLGEYGLRLSIEAGFTEWIKDLSLKKVKPLLASLVAEPKNAGWIQEEKYTFLRSRSAYEYSMKEAKEKYGWEKKDL